MAKATMNISPAFDNFIFDWDYETYLAIGSYGSGKSHAVVQKLILKLFYEKYHSIKEYIEVLKGYKITSK